MNAIRKHFPDQIAALKPLLRAAYAAILDFQLEREGDREARMRDAIRATVPILVGFKAFIPAYKARYIELLEDQETLSPHDLIVCFDRGIYELHTRLPAGEWAHLPWSKALRDLLDERQHAAKAPAPTAERFLASGAGVGRGVVEGTARRVDGRADFERIQSGDIVVTAMTDPEFVQVMERIAGLVTDRGGQLCHAAILAREWGVPCLVGCGDATRTIADGQRIRLDPVAGIVVGV